MQQKITSINPSTNEVIGEINGSTTQEIDKKVSLARKTFEFWSTLPLEKRCEFLTNIYKAFQKSRHEIKKLISDEMGMPITVCDYVDIAIGLNFLDGYIKNAPLWLAQEIVFENAKEIHYLSFEGKGVAGVSAPWNYPFTNFIWGVMQNLIVGNTVVFKHSENCPFTAQLLEEIIVSTKLPEGVFNQVFGLGNEVGEYLMNSDIDLIWFTGSTPVGKHLYQVAAQKCIPAILELGGSAFGIVFEDADLAVVLKSIYENRFINCGQTCDGLKRLIVHESLFEKVVQQIKALLATKKVGPAQDSNLEIGPLVSEKQVQRLEEQVADAMQKGAKIVCGGKRSNGLKGAYYEPTVLTNVSFDMKVWKEEVFAPVLPIVSFKTEEEAIALANDTVYGLGGFIYTQNKERALKVSKKLKTGNINVNAAFYVIPEDPFGGYKKDSGLGREHGKMGLRELCNAKVVALMK